MDRFRDKDMWGVDESDRYIISYGGGFGKVLVLCYFLVLGF